MGAVDEGTVEMMHMFVEMTGPVIKRVRTAHEHDDLHELAEAAHSLKGAARSACCNVLGNFASELQDRSEKNQEPGTLVDDIEKEFERVCEAVKALKTT